MQPRLFYTDHYQIPLPPGHKFPMQKYRLLREALTPGGVFRFEPASLASIANIVLVHDPEYVEAFQRGTLTPAVIRRIGFPWSEELVLRTLASVGGTIAAVHDALIYGWGGTLAGGTHHAFRAEGAGFCVFNDIAVAIAVLRLEGHLQRAAVIDLDVHQGDGTAKLLEADEDALTLSLHGKNNFPFRKQTSRIDVELADGTGDAAYLEALASVLPRVWEFQPEIVIFQSGVDALETDQLGRLALSRDGLRRRDEMVLQQCRNLNLPCAIVLGGGYSNPIELTVAAHASTFLTAASIFTRTGAGN